jgi:Protein of unknown function (DUF1524)
MAHPRGEAGLITSADARTTKIEHIWADHPELHKDQFAHPSDFQEYRNRIGGLLLLPKKL